MRLFFASLLSLLVVLFVTSLSLAARADEPLRSEDARAVDTHVDVGLGVQGYGGNGGLDDAGAIEPYVRVGVGFADPNHEIHQGFVVRDELWGEFGGIGARNAGGWALASAGFSLLPGFRFGDVGFFLGPSARATVWLAGDKTSHAFTATTLPFEARIELFDSPFADLPHVILAGWYAPWPAHHQSFGGRLDVRLEKDTYLFFSIDHTEGLEHEKPASADGWSDAGGVAWDGRFGLRVLLP